MNSASSIRIDDLAKPQHSEFAAQILASCESVETEISVDAIYAEAAEQLGQIEVYRDAGLIERLGVICQAMNDDADLSPLGRISNKTILLRYLVQRSRLEELYRQHPEIEEERIERPIIIAGLPRSGTTHLLNLVARDQRLRSLPYWESLEPIPQASEQALVGGADDPRIARCHEALATQDQLMPLFKNMHEMTAEHTHEEIELMGMDFSMMLFENYALLPAWRDYYTAHDQTPHYRFLVRALKALQWLRGPKRWILKSPQHMEQFAVLPKVFPDASFVLPHREPSSVIASMLTMQTYSSRISREPVRPMEIGQYWSERICTMLDNCARDRDLLPAAQTMDLMFEEITADALGAVKRIYALADLPVTDTVDRAFADYIAANPRGKHGQIVYDMATDFGIQPESLDQRLAFYRQRFCLGT